MNFSLRKIEVQNFRGCRDKVVLDLSDTPSGLYYVRGVNRVAERLGSNGAGKSTLFAESLIWALTGRTSRAQRPGADVENWYSAKTTSVAVEFTLDDAPHSVVRSRNPNALLLDGSKVEQQQVYDLLPLTDAALRKSILIDQFGEMFLDLKPEPKSQLFTDMLDLDRWLRAADLAGDKATEAGRHRDAAARRLEASEAARAEISELVAEAKQKEVEFEERVQAQLAEADKAEKAARRTAAAKRRALDAVRAASGDAAGADRERELNDHRSQLRRLQSIVQEATSRVAATEREAEVLQGQVDQYKNARVCPACGQRVDEKHVREKRTALLGRVEQQRQLLKNYREQVKACRAEYDKTEAAIAELEVSLRAFHEAMAKVEVAAGESLAADKEAHRLRAVAEELETRENPHAAQRKSLARRARQLAEDAELAEGQLRKAEADAALYEFWVRGFREIRLELIDEALLELEIAANRHAEALGLEDWTIGFATERETRRGTVSHGFSVFLRPPELDEPVSWESYCGGEVQRWQLAVTFGLSEILLARAGITVDFEVLDEPTTHMSAEGIEELLECLRDRARELGRRIFLIDHNSLDRGLFDGVVTVARDAKRGTYVEDGGGVVRAPAPRRERAVL